MAVNDSYCLPAYNSTWRQCSCLVIKTSNSSFYALTTMKYRGMMQSSMGGLQSCSRHNLMCASLRKLNGEGSFSVLPAAERTLRTLASKQEPCLTTMAYIRFLLLLRGMLLDPEHFPPQYCSDPGMLLMLVYETPWLRDRVLTRRSGYYT